VTGGKKHSSPSDDTADSKSVNYEPTDTPTEGKTDSSANDTDGCEDSPESNDNNTTGTPCNDLNDIFPGAWSDSEESTSEVSNGELSDPKSSYHADNTDDGDDNNVNDCSDTTDDDITGDASSNVVPHPVNQQKDPYSNDGCTPDHPCGILRRGPY
jgi:hypothetical protein